MPPLQQQLQQRPQPIQQQISRRPSSPPPLQAPPIQRRPSGPSEGVDHLQMKLAELQSQNQARRATPGRHIPLVRSGSTPAGVKLLPNLQGTSTPPPWSARADGVNDPLPDDYAQQNRPPIQYSRPGAAAAVQQGVPPFREQGGDNAANMPVPEVRAEVPRGRSPPRTDVTQLANAFETNIFRSKPEYSLL